LEKGFRTTPRESGATAKCLEVFSHTYQIQE